MVRPEHVLRVVAPLQLGEPVVVRSVCTTDRVLALVVGEVVEPPAAGEELLHGSKGVPRPRDIRVVRGRVVPDRRKQEVVALGAVRDRRLGRVDSRDCPVELLDHDAAQGRRHLREPLDHRVYQAVRQPVRERREPVVAKAVRIRLVEDRVERGVRHRPDLHHDRRSPLLERRELLLRLLGRAGVEDDEARELHPRAVRSVDERREDRQVVRDGRGHVAVEAEHLSRPLDRMADQAASDRRHRMEAELDRGSDPEVAAAAPQGPEQVRIGVGRDVEDATFRRDELDGEHVVGREAVLRHQPPEPAAERQSGDAGVGDRAARGREAVQCRLTVQLGPEAPALGAQRHRIAVDVDPSHRREVDHQRAVDHRPAGDVVTAAAHGDLQPLPPRKVDGIDDVGRVPALRDQRRAPVDHRVVDAPRLFVSGVRRLEEGAAERGTQLVEPGRFDCCHGLLSFGAVCARL